MEEIRKFDYEQSDKKIKVEIYGLEFEINNLDKEKIEDFKNIDENTDVIEQEIENILGKGSVQKINEKRVKDGYKEMDLQIELGLLGFVFEIYADTLAEKTFGKIEKTMDRFEQRINKYQNRSHRRYNNRNNRYRR